jgi:vacuolar-type H+-ATPase subunit H
MGSMLEKLNLVKEAEGKAGQITRYYRQIAEETIAKARVEAEKIKQEEELAAREKGEMEMREMIAHTNMEAEELRVEYMYDRMRLLAVVVERRRDAVAYLVDRLEREE